MAKIVETEDPIEAGRRSAESGARDRVPIKIKRILVPTDLTNESDEAIEFGMVLAKLFGAHLTLLHVYQEPYYAIAYLLGPHAGDRSLQDRMYFENTLKTIAQGVRKEYQDCDIEFRDGVPCEEIVRMAKERDIDLIVISTHHYNWLTRLAYGSDAEQILQHAPCPILILLSAVESKPANDGRNKSSHFFRLN
jgi:nucleotide-binding universal stress UspA family protein